jgi:uncharacterized protein (UPF0332 family)
MSFDGRAFLILAQELASAPAAGGTEDLESARLRSAISRAYYAAFWRARALLLAEGERIPRLDAHQAVIEAFRSSPYRARMALGENLGRLRSDRNAADYAVADDMPRLRLTAARAIDRAGLVLAALDRLTP